MDLIRSICENHKSGRPNAGLSPIIKLQTSPADPWRGISSSQFLQGLVDHSSAQSFAKLVVQQINPLKQFFHPFASKGWKVNPGSKGDKLELSIYSAIQKSFFLSVLFHQVPLVHRKDKSASALKGIATDSGVLFCNAGFRIQENHGHMTSLKTSECLDHGEFFYLFFDSPFSPDASRIYQKVFLAVPTKQGIYRIARGPWQFAHQ